ncbi:hypothetical protein AVEN_124632-1, partial [Araneus ventricosus]
KLSHTQITVSDVYDDCSSVNLQSLYTTMQSSPSENFLMSGKSTNELESKKMKQKISIYSKCNLTIAYKEKPFAFAVVTPMMKRIASLKASVEIIFAGSTSPGDAENHSITFMLTLCTHEQYLLYIDNQKNLIKFCLDYGYTKRIKSPC